MANEWIAQPLIHGTAMSVGVLCDQSEKGIEVLPVGTQRLTTDGRFQYLGGQIPWNQQRAAEVWDVVRRACGSLPNLAGYVGVDLIMPLAEDDPPLLVEINPRLTTSYLGYRQLAEDNLAARLLRKGPSGRPLRWKPRSVLFLPDGSTEWGPGQTGSFKN